MPAKRKKKSGGVYTVLTLIIAAAAAIYWLWSNPGILQTFSGTAPHIAADGMMAVHYIDVGQGDAELIIMPSGEAMLIDAGPGSAEDSLIAYIKAQKITGFTYVIFTHPHEDHIGGGDVVLNKFSAENVLMSETTGDTSAYERLLEAIDGNGAEFITAQAGRTYTLGEAAFKILAPLSDSYKDINNRSVVIKLDYGETSFLFAGDAEKLSEDEMLSKYTSAELRCDVLKVGHHGSSSSSSVDFLSAVLPSFAVISCGHDNDYGHPSKSVLERLADIGAKVYRTDLEGSVVLQSDGQTVSRVK